ncbi:MAG: transcription termination factor Rho [Opitutales bacterium]|nr:transcription termination factor Rho [Opitutales bacterium]
MESRAKLDEFCQTIVDESQEPLDLNEVLAKSNDDLADFASSIDLDEANSRGRIIDSCIASAIEEHRPVAVRGILESMEGGDGIITYVCDNYKIRAKSTFVPRCLIQSLGLRRGQTLMAYVHSPQEQSTCPFAVKVTEVLGHPAEEASKFPRFKDLVPYYPTERIFLEQPGASSGDNLSMRVIDLLSPIGFGQRGLIVAPPRTGKTVLLQGIANAIIHNQPKAKLIVLLIDERPEEVTDFSRQVKGAEVISSTFDESAESHVHAAEIVIENARRWVEAGEHVIILLDSITRLARAYNTEQPSSGKVLSGGVEANALQLPKRFFGSARNIEGGGSLTIIATALIETGSRMDDVIFEEFKGTGNMELHLDRSISDKRIFPAINLERSGTRKEELLYHPDELTKVYSLRRAFQGVPPVEAMEMLINRLKKCPTNVEFLMNLNR